MSYFNYHNKLKKKIASGELESFAFVEEYKGAKPALVLKFVNGESFFVRSERFEEYVKLLQIENLQFE